MNGSEEGSNSKRMNKNNHKSTVGTPTSSSSSHAKGRGRKERQNARAERISQRMERDNSIFSNIIEGSRSTYNYSTRVSQEGRVFRPATTDNFRSDDDTMIFFGTDGRLFDDGKLDIVLQGEGVDILYIPPPNDDERDPPLQQNHMRQELESTNLDNHNVTDRIPLPPSSSTHHKEPERNDRQIARAKRIRGRKNKDKNHFTAKHKSTHLNEQKGGERQNARSYRIFKRRERDNAESENIIGTTCEDRLSRHQDSLRAPGVEEGCGRNYSQEEEECSSYLYDSERSDEDTEGEIEDLDVNTDHSQNHEDELPTAIPVDSNNFNPMADRIRVATRQRIFNKILQETTVVATEIKIQNEGDRQSNYSVFTISSILVVITVGIILGLLLPSNKHEQRDIQITTDESSFSNIAYLEERLWPISGDIIYNETSAQYQTLQWLAYEDLQEAMAESIEFTKNLLLVERYIVTLLYFSTKGPQWLDQMNFLSNSSICEWRRTISQNTIVPTELSKGIVCDNEAFVNRIVLDANNLNGTIPSEIGALIHLQEISFYENNLYGTLPSSIDTLTRLEYLHVQSNFLRGSIPNSLIDLSNLEFCNMNNNKLEGTIPSVITNLKSLKLLELSNNLLTGTIPEFSSSPSELVSLFLTGNYLTGTIPESSISLTNLENLLLNENYLSGSIPSEIGEMERLVVISLADTELTGTIPSYIGRLDRLRYLHLGFNHLRGRIPTEFGRLINLNIAMINDNSLTGPIPSEVGQLPLLFRFLINDNDFTGTLPNSFSELEYLFALAISNTNITGSLESIRCNDNMNDLSFLTSADCGGSTPKVECTCCSICCDHTTSKCEYKSEKTNSKFNKMFLQMFGISTDCNSKDMYSFACTHHDCLSCNEDESICGMNEYLIAEHDPKRDYVMDNKFTYQIGRNETIRWREHSMLFCDVWLNGIQCQNCMIHVCRNGYFGRRIDCTNIIDNDDGIYDTCHTYKKGGVLEYFSWWDLQSWTGCRPAVYSDYQEYHMTNVE